MTVLKRYRRKITRSDAFIAALAAVLRAFILAYAKTLRVRVDSHPEHAALEPSRVLYGFWHGRQFLLVPAFRGSGIAIMTDLSWAGEIQTRVLESLGYVVVRGSSRRSPARALAAMKSAIEQGHPAAFALDGPGGPDRRSKPGILFLARKLGYPVVPAATSASRAWRIPGTWCRYLLPLPFAACVVKLGRPLAVGDGDFGPGDLDREVDRVTMDADLAVGVAPPLGRTRDLKRRGSAMSDEVKRTDVEWRRILTPEQFRVAREKGTEPPFTGKYDDFKGEGVYNCVCCGNPVFRSTEKYDSGSGWPSFWSPVSKDSITTRLDEFGGMSRTEIKCARCGAHLGHVFEDGPQPTGLRYCTNSASLDFEGDGDKKGGEE
ncbi:MAG: peptide-methionine (R)-S-oxide reductase MsrB [Candidatus Eisenbacteria bacterium]